MKCRVGKLKMTYTLNFPGLIYAEFPDSSDKKVQIEILPFYNCTPLIE